MGLECEHTQMVIVSDPVLVHQVLSREGPLGYPLDKAVSGYFGVDMVRHLALCKCDTLLAVLQRCIVVLRHQPLGAIKVSANTLLFL